MTEQARRTSRGLAMRRIKGPSGMGNGRDCRLLLLNDEAERKAADDNRRHPGASRGKPPALATDQESKLTHAGHVRLTITSALAWEPEPARPGARGAGCRPRRGRPS